MNSLFFLSYNYTKLYVLLGAQLGNSYLYCFNKIIILDKGRKC